MKIYFAGSIRGGRDDRALYLEIIEALSRFGEVLTEHVGSSALSSAGEASLSDRRIFERDVAWLGACDAVVAEVTAPSLGVGYELGLAERLGKPVLCLYRRRDGARLSAMVAGNPSFTIAEYTDIPGATAVLERFFERATA